MKKEMDVNTWDRVKNYEWFKTFTNTTYSMNVKMDITKLVQHTKETKESFFIDLLYIVTQGLNSIEEMRLRYENDKVFLYDDINPAITVMTDLGTFENVRFSNKRDFKSFYEVASFHIENAKHEEKVGNEYNPKDCYNEFYITCVPWINFTQFTHPIPDSKESQAIPRICWGKYEEKNGKYEIMLNITVSHLFVDGYPFAQAFNKIQELLDRVEEVLK